MVPTPPPPPPHPPIRLNNDYGNPILTGNHGTYPSTPNSPYYHTGTTGTPPPSTPPI